MFFWLAERLLGVTSVCRIARQSGIRSIGNLGVTSIRQSSVRFTVNLNASTTRETFLTRIRRLNLLWRQRKFFRLSGLLWSRSRESEIPVGDPTDLPQFTRTRLEVNPSFLLHQLGELAVGKVGFRVAKNLFHQFLPLGTVEMVPDEMTGGYIVLVECGFESRYEGRYSLDFIAAPVFAFVDIFLE